MRICSKIEKVYKIFEFSIEFLLAYILILLIKIHHLTLNVGQCSSIRVLETKALLRME